MRLFFEIGKTAISAAQAAIAELTATALTYEILDVALL